MKLIQIFKKSFWRWWEKDMLSAAAALSYNAPLAIIPLLLFSIKATAIVYGEPFTKEVLVEWGSDLGSDLISVINSAINNLEIETNTSGYPLFGIFIVLGISIISLNLLGTNFQRLWEIESFGFINWLKQSFRSFLFILILQLYLLVSFGLEFALIIFKLKDTVFWSLFFIFLSTTSFFFLMFKFIIKNNLKWQGLLAGSLITSTLFIFSRSFINFYIKNITNLDIFGSTGLMLAFLFWIYAISSIIYFGASLAKEFNEAYKLTK